jgi:IclR family transcriptional regulator, KDG regulon repressor
MNNTLRYGFEILELLAEHGRECSTTELAQALGLSKSQVSRVLKTLLEIGYVSQNPVSRQYAINLSVLKLSHNCLANMRQRHIIRPYMQGLVDEFDQACYSSVPVGLEAIVCDVTYPRSLANSATIIAQLGAVNDPYTTGSGKICAAYLNSYEIERLFEIKPMIKYTHSSITDRQAMLVEYEAIRKHRVATSCSERFVGENSVAAPIFDKHEDFIATIGIALPSGKLDDDSWRDYQNKIISTANAISFALGYPLTFNK